MNTIFSYLKNLIIIGLLLGLNSNLAKAQTTYADTLNCNGGTPTFVVDLTGFPDTMWVSDPAERGGSCCTPPDDNCVQFALTLDPGAVGINFFIPGGTGGCGASPSGSLFYQVDCSPPVSVGVPLCLDGPGPFIITFCKPGANMNCYAIESFGPPEVSPGIILGDNCIGEIAVTGLYDTTITWTSVAPGAPGDWDVYLDCSTCDTTFVTPLPGSPPSILYQVCGTSINGCVVDPWCDTVEVQVFSELLVDIVPPNPSICYGETGITLTATATGGSSPYSYIWSTGETTSSIFVSSAGTYYVDVLDSTDCQAVTDTIVVTEYTVPITANAGPNIVVCQDPLPAIDITGSLTGAITGIWSGGTGTYSTDTTDLTLTYTPSASEISVGFVELILTTTSTGSCPGDADTVLISLPSFTTVLGSTVENIDCFGNTTGSIDITPTGGAFPLAYLWSDGSTTEDISSLGAGTYAVIVTDANGCSDSLVMTIIEPPALTSSLLEANINCFGEADGAIDLTVTGGVLPYEFAWSTGETTEDLTGIVAGAYSVVVSDANGCTTGAATTITEPPILISSATTLDVSCFGFADGSSDITVTGGIAPYSYSWSSGETTEDITGLTTGTYNLTVTDANGCVLTESVTVNEPDELVTVAVGTDISCFGFLDGEVDLTVSGGTIPYGYTWSSGAGTEDLTSLGAGTYSVTVTDGNGCSGSSTITVEEPPEITTSTIGTDISCFGLANGTIDFTVTGGTSPYDYLWNTGSTGEDLLELSAGAYAVTVTDLNGCTAADAITLTEPPLLILNVDVTDVSCIGSTDGEINTTVSGGTPGYTYSWSTGSTAPDLTGLTAGVYELTLYDANSCIIDATIEVGEPIDYGAGQDSIAVLCNAAGETVNLNSLLTATTSGTWSEVTSSGQFDVTSGIFDAEGLPAGIYVFNYTIPNFTPCTDEVAVFTVTVHPVLQISFTADNPTGCAPLVVHFANTTMPEGIECVWDFGDGSGTIDCGDVSHTYLYSGSFDVSLEVVTAEGCSSYLELDDVISVIETPEAEFTFKPDVPNVDDPFVQFYNSSIGADLYNWDFGDGSANSGDENPSHTYPDTPNEKYKITLVAMNEIGCSDTAIKYITIKDVVIFFVPNVFTPDGDQYNNEFKPVMTAGYDLYDYHLSIFNRWGELIFESFNADYGWPGTYGDNGLVQDGVYIWTLEFGETMSDKRHQRKGHVTILK